jgi:hypothetical protein
MRVIWRDSHVPKEYKPIKYRGFMIYGSPEGWTTTMKGDWNIYATHYCAQNAIDQAFGDYGKRGTAKRIGYGIQIIGTESKKGRA